MLKVVKALMKNKNKYLLIKRSSVSKFFPNLWDFPGGKIEPNEEIEKALTREVKEETGLEIISNKKLEDFEYTENDVLIYFQLFQVDDFTGNIELSKDHTAYEWIAEEELEKYDLAPIVKFYFSKGKHLKNLKIKL